MGESDGDSDHDLASRDKGYRCSLGFSVPITPNVKKQMYEIHDDGKYRKAPKDITGLITLVALQEFERDAYKKRIDIQNDSEEKVLTCESACFKKGVKEIDVFGRSSVIKHNTRCTCLKTPMDLE